MGQIAYRANLSSATYPMTIADGGRTVIMPGPDQNFDRRVDPTGAQKDAGIPQALYLENVMPTISGYQSVGYLNPTSRTMTVPGGATHIVQCVEIPAYTSFVGPYIYPFSIIRVPLFVWNNSTYTAGIFGDNTVTIVGTAPAAGSQISSAVVRGTCYLYFSAYTAHEIYEVTATITGNVTLTNVTASVTPANFFATNEINTICASSNYLIAQNTTTVYYSSTTTPLDFVSSLVSGAGQIDPNDSDGALYYVKETSGGFYVYAANNCLLAQYTGNARYPWKFAPVKNSTGIYSINLLGSFGGVDTPGHYVIEKNRTLKFLQGTEAIPAAPEASDFLGKAPVQELFNYATNTFTTSTTKTEVPIIYVYLNRYVIVSINGTNDVGAADEKFTHALVFDAVLNRYGKLKIDHSFLFTVQLPKETVAFVNKQTRTISYLTFDIYQTDPPFAGLTFAPMTGVLVLGKFQYVRSRFITLHEVEVEGPQNTAIVTSPNISCVALPSLDGRNFDAPVSLTASTLTGGLAAYLAHLTAQNISLTIKGAFNLSSVQLKFSPRGDR